METRARLDAMGNARQINGIDSGPRTALPLLRTEEAKVPDKGQARLARAVAALLVAAGEALAQETRPGVRRMVVSIPDRKLALVVDDRVIKVYQVAVGAQASPSPAGRFTVVRRVANPAWYGPGKVVRPGKRNPVGTRWIGLSLKGYGIHGTRDPRSIGKPASHGCIRLRNADVEELFELVAAGDAVELVAQRTAETARLFGAPVPMAGMAAGQ